MKHIAIKSCLAAAFAASSAAFAGGAAVSVEQAKALPDDSRVVLEGRIVDHAGANDDEIYWFSDGSGRVKVEIDRDVLRGRTFDLKNTVHLEGEVDKDEGGEVEIEVKRMIELF